MTDLEFEILDEIYFVESFENLQKKLEIEKQVLKDTLKQMIEKGWVKCFANQYTEVVFDTHSFEEKYQIYHYLATKEGLLAHNSR
jgi:DNA-binding HxlR family transcriptional regulator